MSIFGGDEPITEVYVRDKEWQLYMEIESMYCKSVRVDVSVCAVEQLRLEGGPGAAAAPEPLGPWPAEAPHHRPRRHPQLWPPAKTQACLPQGASQGSQDDRGLDHHRGNQHRYGSRRGLTLWLVVITIIEELGSYCTAVVIHAI